MTRESVNNLVYRSLDLQNDLAALVGLLSDVERADQTGELVTEAALREQLTWSGQDPALNSRCSSMPPALSPGTGKEEISYRRGLE